MKRETAQAALEALRGAYALSIGHAASYQFNNKLEEPHHTHKAVLDKARDAIAAIEADLAQPVEPVAWGLFAKVEDGSWSLQHPVRFSEDDAKADRSMYEKTTQLRIAPLYTTPQEPAVNAELLSALRKILEAPKNTMSDGKALKEIVFITSAAVAKAVKS